ncbi:short-chain dehydrogenase/reductase [Lophiotrema nucula]|uniref:Short-chain dehydrogenase/reductase n=1 Tax=Lophiotrema nucula TaxID=690887 RepID=A0A6A5Z7F7_9PLEO|nr:short-chain dehydrogenase/reductase [Lophiotrema nucula]
MVLLFDFINRQFLTEPPIPTTSYKGRTVIVTGANVGLGKEAVRWCLKLGASKVIIACRTTSKGSLAATEIQNDTGCSPDMLEVWKLNMSSYAAVREFAERAKGLERLDAVIANAGMSTLKFNTTEDNEETITTNVISTALLCFALHPKLVETAKQYNINTHITITASELYEVASFKERKAPEGKIFETLRDKKKAKMRDRYNVSKLLQVFLVRQMAALSPVSASHVIVNCVAPGMCHTELHRNIATGKWVDVLMKILARTSEVGSRTLVYGGSAGPETHGKYLPDCKITEPAGLCRGLPGKELQERVWAELRAKLEKIQPGVTSIA